MNDICKKCKQPKDEHWIVGTIGKLYCRPDLDAPEFEAE